MSQLANDQRMTASPAITPRVAATTGVLSISTMRAPATTVIASAPMHTQ